MLLNRKTAINALVESMDHAFFRRRPRRKTGIVKDNGTELLPFTCFFIFVSFRVEFTVGDKPVNSFRMIERHFFRDRMLKTFDFDFGFCIPNSCNTCEHMYEFPQLSEDISK